jgi:predicted unusual protein kinase regulating ubiquinone biosynthesis (AarF/ABC1/UbiB family)
MKQIFEDGFFHADPHPGNLFIYPSPEGMPGMAPAWQLTFIDFGMVGRISPQLRQGLREMVIGVGARDTARLVRSYQMVGSIPSADLDLIERAGVSFRMVGKNMSDLQKISPRRSSNWRLSSELLYSLPFQIPHDLFFGRAVGILSGMYRARPQFNVWEHLRLMPRNSSLTKSNNREFWLMN